MLVNRAFGNLGVGVKYERFVFTTGFDIDCFEEIKNDNNRKSPMSSFP